MRRSEGEFESAYIDQKIQYSFCLKGVMRIAAFLLFHALLCEEAIHWPGDGCSLLKESTREMIVLVITVLPWEQACSSTCNTTWRP